MEKFLNKIIIGFKPERNYFKVINLGGILVDEILDLRDTKIIPKDYYDRIEISSNGENKLYNKSLGNEIVITPGDVRISEEISSERKGIDLNVFEKRAAFLYSKIASSLGIKDINRIGTVFEFSLVAPNLSSVRKNIFDNFLISSRYGYPSNLDLNYSFNDIDLEALGKKQTKAQYKKTLIRITELQGAQFRIMFDIQDYYEPVKEPSAALINKHFEFTKKRAKEIFEEFKTKGIFNEEK